MSAFKGTPGPWHVGTHNDLLYVIDRRPATSNDYPDHNADVAAIAKVYCGNESEANARLIAAAPELLDSNLLFLESVDCLCNITPAWSDDRIYDELPSSGLALAYFAARAAIAKATGGAA